MDAIPLCEITKVYTDIYFNTQQLLLDTTLFYTWRHVSAAHTAIFRPAYNRTGPFICAQCGIAHCLHIKYMWNKYICKTYNIGQKNLTFFLAHEEKYLILIELLTLNSNV